MYIKQWINNKLRYIFSLQPKSSQDIIPQRLQVKIREAKEKNLEELDLSSYQADYQEKLFKIPEEVFELTSLKVLNLSHNQLFYLPESIGNLINLTTLNLSGNQIFYLPESIGELTNLTNLNLSENEFSIIPDFLSNLSNLTSLDLRGNKLADLPNFFANFVNLTNLYLSYNNLSNIPDPLFNISSLKELYLSYNQISTVPDSLSNLDNLTTLYLRNNQISSLPNSIAKLDKLTTLELRSNPLENPPIEIVIQGVKSIKEYFHQFLEEEDYSYEAKLLIIGKARVGKTSLVKKISNTNYNLEFPYNSDKGIVRTKYSFSLDDKKKEFIVNIWDVDEKKIDHRIYQFLFTQRSLYILVIDNFFKINDLYYWLYMIQVLSHNSPVLLVKNEKDDRPIKIPNELDLRQKFTNIKAILTTNLATNKGLAEIITQIKYQIKSLEHIGTVLPSSWIKVRHTLEQDRRYFISLDEFLQICREHGLTLRKDQLQLSKYFHDLGFFIHFQEQTKSLLYKNIILKPVWVINAICQILNDRQLINNQGYFTYDYLQLIWHKYRYTLRQEELLELMIELQLCYQIPNSYHNFIVPQLLSQNPPQYLWDNYNNLILHYRYKYFMPKGIISSFIVAMHKHIEQQRYVWKNGVILRKNKTRAEVIEYYSQQEIIIRVSGVEKRSLMTIITQKLDEINYAYQAIYTVNSCLRNEN